MEGSFGQVTDALSDEIIVNLYCKCMSDVPETFRSWRTGEYRILDEQERIRLSNEHNGHQITNPGLQVQGSGGVHRS